MTTNDKITAAIGTLLIDAAFDKIAPDAVADLVYEQLISAGIDDADAEQSADAAQQLAGYIDPPDENQSDDYCDEAAELKQLNNSINEAVKLECSRQEAGNYCDSWFTIIINGRCHRFLVGGPQIAALSYFVEHLADENQHNID